MLVEAADESWQPYELPFDPDGMGGVYVGTNRHLRNGVYDTIVEVIDIPAGQLLPMLDLTKNSPRVRCRVR